MSDEILLEIEDGVATVTLNRPERLNTLAIPTVDRLVETLSEAAGSDDVRVVVLAGNGRRFCAGADQAEMIERDSQAWEPIVRRYLDPVRTIVAIGHPTESALEPKSRPGAARLPREQVVYDEAWPDPPRKD